MRYFKDIKGERFGRLIVIERIPSVKHGQEISWICKCDCGNTCTVKGTHLRNGATKSCGCLRTELTRERSRKLKTIHGESNTRLYKIWACMKNRCSSPNNTHFDCYGGRGIHVCDEWQSFENFRKWANINGYDETLTLDRIDNNGNYEPSNCRWISRKEQANNRRTNRFIEFNGQVHSLARWAEIIGMQPRTLSNRLDAGWTVERAFTQPVKVNNQR